MNLLDYKLLSGRKHHSVVNREWSTFIDSIRNGRTHKCSIFNMCDNFGRVQLILKWNSCKLMKWQYLPVITKGV